MLKQVDCVLGNSSSGIIEAPSLGVGSINIGERQDGREMSDSVISCAPVSDEIDEALERVLSNDFRSSICIADNVYEYDQTSAKITEILECFPLKKLLKRNFSILIASLNKCPPPVFLGDLTVGTTIGSICYA